MNTVISPYYGYLKTKAKRLWNIKNFARSRSLNIEKYELLGAHLIALDPVKSKLVYAARTPGSSSCLIVDLAKCEQCIIRKVYGPIDAGELKFKKVNLFLRKVFLQLIYKGNSGKLSLLLFDSQTEGCVNLEQLEVKAKHWQRLVSSALPVQIQDRA
ncbi:hypothetical protein EXU57_23340 [Segetibacter sp. 3557_3]|uniref:hypothetical protein n=1 Tax=Segetibacter sp. 3557_3 TaxID=2547429 RepID=UPI0010588D43|nr:hypothetical protein [Segetibacter sp. 3557_3]TDH18401.1 hypothetical protein EXU57_23340 [Segetibacter sp. 3557_3]